MDNHFHLLLRTPNADLSRGMHDFNAGYATLFNRKYERAGSLFQGRFKAILAEDDSYACTLSRYIHLNPVRAGMVRRPQQFARSRFAWSSYRHFLDSRGAPGWLDWKTVLDEMGKNRSRTSSQMRCWARPTGPIRGKNVWEPETMIGTCGMDGTQNDRPTTAQIQEAVAQEFAVDKSTILPKRVRKNEARSAALYLIRKLTSEPVTGLSRQFGRVSPAAISKPVKRAEERLGEDRRWKRRLDALESQLMRGT